MKKSSVRYRYRYLICFLFIANYCLCFGQMALTQESVELIEKDVIAFLIKHDELEAGKTIQEYRKRIGISEILEERVLGYDRTGIYRVRIYTSHTKQYLLIKSDAKHEIVDTDSLGKTLQEVTNQIVDLNLPNDRARAYVEAVIELYNINENRDPVKPRKN
jgi:hypothetical protein